MKLTTPVEKNDDIELTIAALGSEGQGIGRVSGYAVFVPLALEGERVRAHVMKVTSGYAVAKLTEVLEPSAARCDPFCAAYPRCGGCTLQHMDYPAQLAFKRAQVREAFERIGGFEGVEVLETLGMEAPLRYRNKGSFPFGKDESGQTAIGFFAPRSHRLVPIEDCPIQSEAAMAAVIAMRDWARKYDIPPYDEATGTGTLRHAMARVSGEEVTALVVTAGELPHEKELIEALKGLPGLCGVIHDRNDSASNVILGGRFRTLWGSDRMDATICGYTFGVGMASFLQVNPEQTEKLYLTALDYLSLEGGETVADVYCGVGTISLLLAGKCARVTGVECVPEAVADARANAARNGVTNAEFICGDAEKVLPDLLRRGMKPDAAVIDPPRKGCEPAALCALADSGVRRIVYVSCNPSTLARDCRLLAQRGYAVKRVQPVDMFPHTHHVEAVVELQREN